MPLSPLRFLLFILLPYLLSLTSRAQTNPSTVPEATLLYNVQLVDVRTGEVLPAPPATPQRAFTDAAGNSLTLHDLEGQVVVVNLWATWCAPCMEEMPSLAVLQRNFAGRIAVVPISVDSEGERDKAISELRRLSGGSLPFLQDMTRGVLFDAQAAGMPVTIIYNRQGQEIARLAGGANWGSEDASRLIEAVLAEQ